MDQSSYTSNTNVNHVFQELDEGEENSCWSVLFSEFERFSLETVGTFVADSELTLNLKSTNKTLHGDEWQSPATNEDYHNISRESRLSYWFRDIFVVKNATSANHLHAILGIQMNHLQCSYPVKCTC